PQRDEVEPAAAAAAAGDGAVLVPELAHPLVVRALDLGRERTLADACHVRLRDAEDAVDAAGADADAGGRVRSDGVRRRHEGIGAVVEVEQGRLRTLEEDVFAV